MREIIAIFDSYLANSGEAHVFTSVKKYAENESRFISVEGGKVIDVDIHNTVSMICAPLSSHSIPF